jgi:endonuclease/exonuclease/phosphatase family metal-dependent hydrolase
MHLKEKDTEAMNRKLLSFFLLLLLINASLVFSQGRISIASFNLRVFGQTKAAKEPVMDIIADIIRHFDIVAVQEIRDKEETAIYKLLSKVNRDRNEYALVVGPRLGRTSSKEQYAIFYRTSLLEMVNSPKIYDDVGDPFEREPLLAMFKVKNGNFDFILADIHTKPEDAIKEISLLPSVMQYAGSLFEDPDVLCLGDWNADGSYFNENAFLSVFPQDHYFLIIPNSADTSVASKSNSYDRMVATATMKEDWTGEWGVYRFDAAEGFGNRGVKPADISDHYPVWAIFYADKDSD